MHQFTNIDDQFFSIIKSDGREFVNLNELIRLKSNGNCTWVYLTDGRKILTTKNIGHYQEMLPSPEYHLKNTFFRIHHQHLINLGFISRISVKKKLLSLSSNEELPIAQRRLKFFLVLLKKFNLY